MKKVVLVFFGILQFFETPSFSATRCDNSLPPLRLSICNGMEAAKQGIGCQGFEEGSVGQAICLVVSQIANAKSCDTLQNPKIVNSCNSVYRGFEYAEKLRAVREARVNDPKLNIVDPPTGLSSSWFEFGKYLGLNQPQLVEKNSESKTHLLIESQRSVVRTKLYDPNLQEKVLRIAKKTFFRLRKAAKSPLQPKEWTERVADFVVRIEKEKTVMIQNSQKENKPLLHSIQDGLRLLFPVHVTPEGQIVIYFDDRSNFEKIKEADFEKKEIYYGFDYGAEKFKALIKAEIDANERNKKQMIVQSWFKEKLGIASIDYWFEYQDHTGPKVLAVMDYYPMTLESFRSSFKIYDSWEDEDLEELSVALAWELVQGVEEIHRQNIHHRDIKDTNILVDGNGKHAYLTDFGLFYDLQNPPRPEILLDNRTSTEISGSPYLVSPEYITTLNPGLVSNDTWALALTLFELSTGEQMETSASTGEDLVIQMHQLWLGRMNLNQIFYFMDKGKTKKSLLMYSCHPGTLRFVVKQMLNVNPVGRISLSSAADQLKGIMTGNDEGPRFRFFPTTSLAVE